MLKQILITEQSQNNPSTTGDGRSAVDKNFCHHHQDLTGPHQYLDSKLGEAEFAASPVTQWDDPCDRMSFIIEVKVKDLGRTFLGCDGEKSPPKIQRRPHMELRVKEG